MAIVFTMDNRRPQDFTGDSVRLRAAIDRFTKTGGLTGGPVLSTAMEMSVETLVRASEFLIDLPERRKALIYVGTGVPVDFAMAATPLLLTKDSDPGLVIRRELHIRAVQRVSAALAAAERANVNVYAFDAKGLRQNASGASLAVEFMQTIAINTGGKAFINNNDFVPGSINSSARTRRTTSRLSRSPKDRDTGAGSK
jgi:hypothetical protein